MSIHANESYPAPTRAAAVPAMYSGEARHSIAFHGVARYLLWVAAILVTINLVIWPIMLIVVMAALASNN
jgi:hypothetical protein